MGKKSKSKNNLPLVSVCTPTYNRRPFIPAMISCFNNQTYPKDKIEWIIIDDGTDKIEDLVSDIPNVKYYKYDTKMPLGKKRNIMHEKSTGEILVYMDDDDYYPPERISHAVNMLQTHPKALCAGASEIYIYFKHINKIVQFGPYGPNHATAGTFAFKRELLKEHRYNDNAALAEEKAFLKDYTVPFVQLEPKKTILVFSHEHNTFDKKKLLENRHPNYIRDTDKKVEEFVKEEELREFYMNKIVDLLKEYEPGRPEMKQDVLKQIDELTKEREEMMKKQMNDMKMQQQQMANSMGINNDQLENLKKNPSEINRLMHENQVKIHQNQVLMQMFMESHLNSQQSSGQIIGEINGKQEVLNNQQIVEILKQQDETVKKLKEDCMKKDHYISLLETKLNIER
jgi:glycosyltransferase involved in cell wall biosynthesis